MTDKNRVSTGMVGFDSAIDMLRLGDNVVWQVVSIDEYIKVIAPFIKQSKEDGRKLVYFRFGAHPPIVEKDDVDVYCEIDPSTGFENFTSTIYSFIANEGKEVFYIFDCLSDLLQYWYSDLMIGNFFRVICPFLYKMDTVAYFAIKRGSHTYNTVARIRETTQLLLDLHFTEEMYIHPLKVWERYSPTMFFPHQINGSEAIPITSSGKSAELFADLDGVREARDYWERTLDEAKEALSLSEKKQQPIRELLINLILGREPRMVKLCRKYFTLEDLLRIASREIGTGRIGGKSVGMLLAREILEEEAPDVYFNYWEPHDSYFLGADIFYTYIIQNGWWDLRSEQKTVEGYFTRREELQENLLVGEFPVAIKEQFKLVLEHFGQSPIIVRSSSLLEDNFGNAFAGKYESIFCVNQGTPEVRYEAFENAVRRVYASTMNFDALNYRKDRGLVEKDEQMAILVQRVSGDYYGDYFFPHLAGVGNSVNLYLWNRDMDMYAGMLRIVFGLGTRAVDRLSKDYARIVSLDCPEKQPPMNYEDERKFSQHGADILNVRENTPMEISIDELYSKNIHVDKSLFFKQDHETARRLRELGMDRKTPILINFQNLLTKTDFPVIMRKFLSILQEAYDYPVDIEYTANFFADGTYKVNILQCRPLQTRNIGGIVSLPSAKLEQIFIETSGNFMGGNVTIPMDYVIFVKPKEYLALSEQDKYSVARTIGNLNQELQNSHTLLIGPGRWGTTTPSLGVPVHFTELSHMSAICEVSYKDEGLMPELSFGSHFFQDVVESGIFYLAIFQEGNDEIYLPEKILNIDNCIDSFIDVDNKIKEVLHVAKTHDLILHSDVGEQKLLCYWR